MAFSRIMWDAMSAILPASAGPAEVFIDGTNSDQLVLAFTGSGGGSADELCFFRAPVPQQYNTNRDFTIYLYWDGASGASASDNVSWDVSYLGVKEDAVIDSAFTATVTVNDLLTAVGDIHVAAAAFSSPTLARGDLLVLKVNRDYDEANSGTAMAEDAYLYAIEFRQD
jgi:hypothetical protein